MMIALLLVSVAALPPGYVMPDGMDDPEQMEKMLPKDYKSAPNCKGIDNQPFSLPLLNPIGFF